MKKKKRISRKRNLDEGGQPTLTRSFLSNADAGLSREQRSRNRFVSAGSRRNDSVQRWTILCKRDREESIVVVTIVAFLPYLPSPLVVRRSIGHRLARPWLEYGGHESLHQVPVHYPGWTVSLARSSLHPPPRPFIIVTYRTRERKPTRLEETQD